MKNPCLENLIISPGHCWGPGRCGRYYHLNGCKLQGRGKNLTFGLNHAGAWAHEIRCYVVVVVCSCGMYILIWFL